MVDCIECKLRLETAAGQMKPFCANEECVKFDKKELRKAMRLVH